MATDLAAQLAALDAEFIAADALLSDSDKAELAARDAIAEKRSKIEAKKNAARDLSLARQIETARSEHADRKFRIVTVQEYTDGFIVQSNNAAHAKWRASIDAKAGGNKKIDSAEEERKYAVACVYMWNSKMVDDPESTVAYDLKKYLEANQGVVTPLAGAAAALNGVLAEERKS